MSWRDILKEESQTTSKISNISNNDFNLPDFPDIPGGKEIKKPSLEHILDLSGALEAFEERAAIIEFDGDRVRKEANQLAYERLMEKLENELCFSWLTFNKHYKMVH